MVHSWEGAGTAGAWQISTVPVISAASLLGALSIFEEAGIEAVRRKSLMLTSYLIELTESLNLTQSPYHFRISTPRSEHERGGHVAIEHDEAARIVRVLKSRGIIPDFRAPDVIRLAPVALYTRFVDVWRTVQTLREIVDSGEHLRVEEGRSLVA